MRAGALVGAGLLTAGLAVIVPLSGTGRSEPAGALPDGFVTERVGTVRRGYDLAPLPDDRLLVTSQLGQVWVIDEDIVQPTPALDLSGVSCSNDSAGPNGIVADPDVDQNGYVYLYYTVRGPAGCVAKSVDGPWNRVSRFTMQANTIDPASEVVLLDRIQHWTQAHLGGDIDVGPDGALWIITGDGSSDQATGLAGLKNPAAQARNTLIGKVLRIATDGSIPADNPFHGEGTARCDQGAAPEGTTCQEIWAFGLRNPFRMSFDPTSPTVRLLIGDVGQRTWEEINEVTPATAGADFGWNRREGRCSADSATDCPPPPTGVVDPLYSYDHEAGCTAVAGNTFVPPGTWPGYEGVFLFGDYVCNTVWSLRTTPAGVIVDEFAQLGPLAPVSMTFTNGALYYLSNDAGQVFRIRPSDAANRAPVASLTATPTTGPAPLAVTFDASASSDLDGDPLRFEWSFGDGTTDVTPGPTTTHVYTTTGPVEARLVVRDGRGGVSAPVTVAVTVDGGNQPPVITLVSPAADFRYTVGRKVTVAATARDPEEGLLPDDAVSIEILLHHDEHTHPVVPPTPGTLVRVTPPPPEDLAAATTSHLEAIITATDSQGGTAVRRVDVLPHTTTLRVRSVPKGRQVVVAGTTVTTPATLTVWKGWTVTVEAPDQAEAGRQYVWTSWSGDRPQAFSYKVPARGTTFTARFTGS